MFESDDFIGDGDPGRYRLTGTVAADGGSEVLRAEDTRLGRRVLVTRSTRAVASDRLTSVLAARSWPVVAPLLDAGRHHRGRGGATWSYTVHPSPHGPSLTDVVRSGRTRRAVDVAAMAAWLIAGRLRLSRASGVTVALSSARVFVDGSFSAEDAGVPPVTWLPSVAASARASTQVDGLAGALHGLVDPATVPGRRWRHGWETLLGQLLRPLCVGETEATALAELAGVAPGVLGLQGSGALHTAPVDARATAWPDRRPSTTPREETTCASASVFS